ncbi:P-loop containing nucleoside triphosphate hydrolase protein [Fimicolochytrium jonesii]|uniref:P-loop containing nucleoside triphosphate hydrolase protein n=1 Tax=Fimicolochytrium jonesii TaxID=1396493 RepID=UPI0022FF3A60|nr:P-loop containing nucleoside triphosphate hydrolase protein [Fimicolochytrium jonesii]KAI8817604.1 P-loop containing nucleoside triphosphate hydrolase protein [Fimicolochytrium jonesii]
MTKAQGSTENVLVTVRCRPFSQKELAAGHKKIVTIDSKVASVNINDPRGRDEPKQFTFDAAFDEDCTQQQVYDSTARIIVDAVLDGFNGTVFCYGQTGTGKTFSMQGISDVPELRGIIPQAFHHIFSHIAHRSAEKKFLVRVSFLEIYNEDIKDLLIKQKVHGATKTPGLELKEHPETGVYVKDLGTHVVKNVPEMEALMALGNKNRSVGATLMNENSSRSHSIFTVTVESSEPGPDGKDRIVAGKLHLVDLAGSERQSKTGATGDRLHEATRINLSLSALGNCIGALVDGRSTHIPYRDSKLTRLLQDSLGGNAKTLMIATLSPASYNFDETISTLRYANRAKNIKNKPKVNEDPKDAMLKQCQEEIEKLKMALAARQRGADAGEGGAPQPRIITKIVKKRVVKKVPRIIQRAASVHLEGEVPPDEVGEEGEESEDEEEGVENDVVVETSTDPNTVADSENPLAGLDPETIRKLEEQVEAEKRALLASKDMLTSDKERIAAELEQRANELEAERTMRETLATKLRALETQLIIGGGEEGSDSDQVPDVGEFLQRIEHQELQLAETQSRLQAQALREHQLQQQLEARQDLHLQMEEHYASLQEEVDIKTKKLGKLFTRLQAAKSEINDLEDEFRAEREDFLDTIRELTRELSLKTALIENFVPVDDRKKVEAGAVFDDETDEWFVSGVIDRHLVKRVERPRSLGSAVKRPICRYARMMVSLGDPNPRWRIDNVLTLKLDMPAKTTISPTPTRNTSPLKGALDSALEAEDEWEEITVAETDFAGYRQRTAAANQSRRRAQKA